MKLLDVLTAPWAIEPAKLLEIQTIYATHLRGEKIDIAAVEARLGRSLDNTPAAYTVVDGVAVLQVNGVMAKRANMFMDISGGTSMQLAARALQQAADDTQVHSIIQVFDTPGGTVDGTQSFANTIARVNAIKPVITLADGTMASAGVWAGSAGRQIYLADATTAVGSIGVVSQHVDLSGRDAQAGIKRTEVFAGKYKRIASDTGPLSAEGLQSMQDQVDYIYSLFVQAVATHRGTTIDQVLANMADGRMFTGQQVIAAGLADGIATLDELIVQLNQDRSRSPATGRISGNTTGRAPIAATPPKPPPPRTVTMTPEQLAIDHPEAVASIRTDAASAERARIQAVEAQAIPGHDALIASLKFDGKSTAGDAAMAVLAAEKTARTSYAKALVADAPAPLALVPAPAVEAVKTADQKAAHAQAHAREKGVSIVAALKELGYA
jgi:signal peptide peptidase SppA